MSNKRPSLDFDVVPALSSMQSFFDVQEVANRTLEGGWELLFRNRLLRVLQGRQFEKCLTTQIDRECVVVPSKRKMDGAPGDKSRIADIAYLAGPSKAEADRRNPLAVVEIKHNFATQSQAFTSILKDVEKWSDWKRSNGGRQCEFHFIQLITDVNRLTLSAADHALKDSLGSGSSPPFSEDVCKDFFKYSIQPDEKRRKARIDDISNRLKEVQEFVDNGVQLHVEEFSANSSRYFEHLIDYRASIHVFVVSQRANAHSAIDRQGLPKPEAQKGLIHYAKA